MLEACRTCLTLIDVDNLPFYEIEADDMQLSKESCRHKLLSIVPEMELNITPKSMICAECHRSLEALFDFKAKCLKTENIIAAYLKAKPDVDIKNFDLKDVSAFNGVDIKNTQDVAVDAFVENVAIKEEVESSDGAEEFESITIVKHEVDNCLPESVEFVDPENKVLKPSEEIEKGNFKCSICSENFVSKYRMRKHKVVHTNEKLHRCKICDKTFSENYRLKVHIRWHTGERPYKCEMCQKEFIRHDYLTKHQKSQHSLKIHMPTHTDERPYKCEICQKKFMHRSSLKTHLAKHAKDKPHCCKICQKQFRDKEDLMIHMRIHTSEKSYEYKPDVDMKNFDLKDVSAFNGVDIKNTEDVAVDESITIVKHEVDNCLPESVEFVDPEHKVLKPREELEKDKFKCAICTKIFESTYRLKRHMFIHTNKQLHRCEICDKAFFEKVRLKVHIRKHTGERPYECQTCQKRFIRPDGLKQHQKTHSGVKEFKCEFCNKGFSFRNKLTTHLLTHTSIKPYHCDICDKRFREKASVKVHMRIHTGERPYECKICYRKFTQRTNLKIHQKVHINRKRSKKQFSETKK